MCRRSSRAGAWHSSLSAGVVVLALPFVFGNADPPLPKAGRPGFRWRSFIPSFVRSCWPYGSWTHDFSRAWLARFLLVLGNAMAVIYLLYFLRRIGFSVMYPGHPPSRASSFCSRYTPRPWRRPPSSRDGVPIAPAADADRSFSAGD